MLTVIHWVGLAWGVCQAEGLMGRRGQEGEGCRHGNEASSCVSPGSHVCILLVLWMLVYNEWVIMSVILGSPAAHVCDLWVQQGCGE